MNTLTHTLTGYLMSRAGLNRWCPRATPILLLAANIPDVDFLAAVGGSQAMLEWHRGPTHSVVLLPVVALLPLAVMRAFSPEGIRWRRAYVVSILGVVSHLLLDWMNIYGVRLLWPFSAHYYRLDIAGIFDLWVLVLLLSGVAWMGLSRLVSTEIGARPATGQAVAVTVLALFGGWEAARFLFHQRAVEVLAARIYAGEAPERVEALPRFASPFRWRGLVETRSAEVVVPVNLLARRFDPEAGCVYYQAAPSPAIEAARRTRTFRCFLHFSPHPLWRVVPAASPRGALRVRAVDLRFGTPAEGRFTATALVAAGGRVLRARFQFRPPGRHLRFH